MVGNMRRDGEPDAREKLMLVAERLFADRGYFGASIRDITLAAGQRLAAVNYHFGSKEALFKEVIVRRAFEINSEREALIGNLPSPEIGLEEYTRLLVEAFVGPVVQRAANRGEGWNNYARLLGTVAATKIWVTDIMAEHFDPVARLFLDKARLAFKDSDDYSLHCMFQFMLGQLNQICAQNGRIESVSDGRYSSGDLMRSYEKMVPFVVAGMLKLSRP